MATLIAMWLQEADLAHTNHLIMIFIGLVAVAMTVMAIALLVLAVTASKAIGGIQKSVDEVKYKVLPLMDVATQVSKSTQSILEDVKPKVKHITDNLVVASDTLAETSKSARAAVQQFDATITDVNRRTQVQVARVDNMVSAALTTTAEVVDAIGNGIRGPALKIVAMATQVKGIADAVLGKMKAAAASKFGGRSGASADVEME